MDTWRCPTCLTVLVDGSARRCPACHSKLRRRSKAIVLGETSRLDRQAALVVDKWNQQRSAHAFSSEAAGPAPRAVAPVEVLVEEEPIEAILEDVIDDEAGVLGGDVTAIVDALHRKARGDA